MNIVADCPSCRGNGECCVPTSTVEGYDGPFPCSECEATGAVPVLCAAPGCWAAATRRLTGDPSIAYCTEHDRCALCDAAPAGADDLCVKCAADLAAVVPVASDAA